MSGGSYNYICDKLSMECAGSMYDAEMNGLIVDLCKVLHDLEWWQSCDSSEEVYRKTVAKFKEKWFHKGEWIPVKWIPNGRCGYPGPEEEYKYFLTIDNKGEITIQEFLLSLDEEPQPYFSGMRNIVAWQPLPEPYKAESGVRSR